MTEFKLLMQLSNDCKAQACFMQAAKCLAAASTSAQALPASRAMACLDYAQLLLDHFDNQDLVKKLLLQAERELRPVRGHYGLKCEVFHHLIACHRLNGDLAQAMEACQAGLAAAQDPHAKDLARWRIYFFSRIAECRMEKDNDPDGALAAIQEATTVAGLLPLEAAILALSRAVIALHCGRIDDVDEHLNSCAAVLEELVEEVGEDDENVARLRGHYFLLYAAAALAVGRGNQLLQDNEYPVFAHVQLSLNAASMEGGGWLPGPAAAALSYMLHAGVLRAAAKGSAAAVQLSQAEELIEQVLAHMRVNTSEGESAVAPNVLANAAIYLRLKAALAEQRTLAALVSTDLMSAARHAVEVVQIHQAFPTILKKQFPSACMLLGHYAHTLEDYSLASALFTVVQQSPAQNMHKLAALSSALTELQRGGDDCLTAAVACLEGQQLMPASLQGLPAQEKATAQLVNGMILRQQGDITGARYQLTKALKQAHSFIGCTQLVGQILNVLAPVQQERQDVSGAKQMFESATVLMKSINDLPCLLTALRGMHALHEQEGNKDVALKSQQYLDRKAADLANRLKEAKTSGEHVEVVKMAQWLLSVVPKHQ